MLQNKKKQIRLLIQSQLLFMGLSDETISNCQLFYD